MSRHNSMAENFKLIYGKDVPMDKYAVEVDDDKTKTASEGRHCPDCGAGIHMDDMNVPVCPNCGTKPFEKQK